MAKILLVEDEIDIAEMYRDSFLAAGHEISLAFTAAEAMEKLKEEKPELIILDILLPTENGISFLGKIKKDPDLSKIRVIALSNYDEPKTKKEAFELGVKDYLIKTDFTPSALVEEIEKTISEHD